MFRPASVSLLRNSEGEPSGGTEAAVSVAVPTRVVVPIAWLPVLKKPPNRKPVVVLPLAVACDVPLAAEIVTWLGVDRSTVSTSPPPLPAFTVNVTGTDTIAFAGSLVATHTFAVYVPAARPVALPVTVTSELAPPATEPLVGDSLSHGMSLGFSQPTAGASPSSVTTIVRWKSGKPMPLVVVGVVRPQPADDRNVGCVSVVAFAPG